ncbi:MAG TPA: GDSL-type esterase/lipase family protein [Cyclobacteriaceae bacterium]|jgi:lysophospholipase L1-like esterase|nr:GDSL-type esterase/lipase family protein [Cyclobacteriaceae bacterium]
MKRSLFPILLVCSGLALGQRLDTVPNLPEHYVQRLEKFKKEPVVSHGIVFLGNSITEGGDWKTLLKDSTIINRGISGDNTFGVLNRIGDVTLRQPDKLFMLIGINDLSKSIPDEIIFENILSIVGRIHSGSPNTKVYVQSILPLNATNEKFPQKFLDKESHVLTINGQLKKMASKMKYTYVDLYNEFTDGQGRLDEKLTTDGLHLNKSGYELWVRILRKEKYL